MPCTVFLVLELNTQSTLLSIPYLVTSVSAQQGTNPSMNQASLSQHVPQGCAAFHPGGAATHVDPPESQIEEIEAEYEASCKAENCDLSAATYSRLESQGHSRVGVMCFIAESEAEHEGGNHENQHHDQGNMNQGDPCMQAPARPDRVACYEATPAPVGVNHNEKASSAGECD